jgi:hypothetical protein
VSELFPQSAREYAIERVARALAEELPGEEPAALSERADAIVAIGDSLGIPFEALIRWAHYKTPVQEKSLLEFRRWAEIYAATMRALPPGDLEGAAEETPRAPWEPAPCGHCGEVLLTDAAAAAHVCHLVCPQCSAHSAQRVAGHWICANCGEVTV